MDIGDWASGCRVCSSSSRPGQPLCDICTSDPEIWRKFCSSELAEEQKATREREATENAARREQGQADCAARIQAMPGATVRAKPEIGSNGCPRCIAVRKKTGSYDMSNSNCDVNFVDPRLKCNRCLPGSE